MKICLDARWIFPELSGIGLYTQELIQALAREDRVNEYTLLFQDADVRERTRAVTHFDQSPRFHTQLVDYGLFSIKNQIRLPRLLKEGGFDVYHSTNYMMPLLCFGTGEAGRHHPRPDPAAVSRPCAAFPENPLLPALQGPDAGGRRQGGPDHHRQRLHPPRRAARAAHPGSRAPPA
jgi:hypothetical protein